MIDLVFVLSTTHDVVQPRDYALWHRQLTQHKHAEMQVSHHGNDLLALRFSFAPSGRDHAGLMLEFSVLRYCASITIYDHRHWDYDQNQWRTTSDDI